MPSDTAGKGLQSRAKALSLVGADVEEEDMSTQDMSTQDMVKHYRCFTSHTLYNHHLPLHGRTEHTRPPPPSFPAKDHLPGWKDILPVQGCLVTPPLREATKPHREEWHCSEHPHPHKPKNSSSLPLLITSAIFTHLISSN